MHEITASPTQLALTFKIAMLLLLVAGVIITALFLRKKAVTVFATLFATLKITKGERALLKLKTVSTNEKVEISKSIKLHEEGNVLLHDLAKRLMLGTLQAFKYAMEQDALSVLNVEKVNVGFGLLLLAVGVWNTALVQNLAPMTYYPFGNLGSLLQSQEAKESGLADILSVVLPKNEGNNNNGGGGKDNNGGIAGTFNRNVYNLPESQRQKLAVAIVKYAIAKVSS